MIVYSYFTNRKKTCTLVAATGATANARLRVVENEYMFVTWREVEMTAVRIVAEVAVGTRPHFQAFENTMHSLPVLRRDGTEKHGSPHGLTSYTLESDLNV